MGGRNTKSGLYRVTYTGASTPPLNRRGDGPTDSAREIRHSLEKYHGVQNPAAIDLAWKYLADPDRFIQFAARVALEFQDPKLWTEKALNEKNPVKVIHALLALARVSAPCPEHTKEKKVVGDRALRTNILANLTAIEIAKLSDSEKLDLLRVYEIVFNRFGKPFADSTGPGEWDKVVKQLDPIYPDKNRFINGELCQILVALEVPSAAKKSMKLLNEAPTQEEQLEYARYLRMLRTGWTPELRKEYFTWFLKSSNYKGGSSFQGFTRMIKADAVATLTAAEQASLKEIINANPATVKLPQEPPRPFVKAWKLDDLIKLTETALKSGRDYDRGRKLFAAGKCFSCHRYDNEGGSNAPDLTGLAGRYSHRDVLEKIVDPNKSISDQYAAVEIRTNDERIVVGRIVNLNNDEVMVNTDMTNPGSTVNINRKIIESMKPSKISMMPSGLLDTFKDDEILDLLAYILSRGDRKNAMFQK
jgi:putative heme-binding domain-containing protein